MADPRASSRRLNLADQVLVNALAAILLPVIHDPARERMLLDVLREVLPQASGEHPQMMAVYQAAQGFFDGPVLDVPREIGAKARAVEPLVRFFEARTGAALDTFRAAKTGVADA